MLVQQPPNSPMCNVKDAYIVPAMSKAFLSIHAATYNNKLLDGDDINNCVQQAWRDLPTTTILIAYLHDHQNANAIFFYNAARGLHYSVCCYSLPIYDKEALLL